MTILGLTTQTRNQVYSHHYCFSLLVKISFNNPVYEEVVNFFTKKLWSKASPFKGIKKENISDIKPLAEVIVTVKAVPLEEAN